MELEFYTREAGIFIGDGHDIFAEDTDLNECLNNLYTTPDDEQMRNKISNLFYIPFIDYVRKYIWMEKCKEEKIDFELLYDEDYVDYCVSAFEKNGLTYDLLVGAEDTDRCDLRKILNKYRIEEEQVALDSSMSVDVSIAAVKDYIKSMNDNTALIEEVNKIEEKRKRRKDETPRRWIERKFEAADFNVENRKTVFLWCFGLGMNEKAASLFLRKASRSYDFYFKSPEEIVYYYCLKNGKSYADALRIIDECKKASLKGKNDDTVRTAPTIKYQEEIERIISEDELKRRVHALYLYYANEGIEFGRTKVFKDLLDNFRKKIGSKDKEGSYDEVIFSLYGMQIAEIEKHIERNGLGNEAKCVIQSCDKEDKIDKNILTGLVYDIWEKNIAMNWQPFLRNVILDKSGLCNKRNGKRDVQRDNIITLAFMNFIFDNRYEIINLSPQDRIGVLNGAIVEINSYLERAHMHPFYWANPYEAFITICLLSKDPEFTYKMVFTKIGYDMGKAIAYPM